MEYDVLFVCSWSRNEWSIGVVRKGAFEVSSDKSWNFNGFGKIEGGTAVELELRCGWISTDDDTLEAAFTDEPRNDLGSKQVPPAALHVIVEGDDDVGAMTNLAEVGLCAFTVIEVDEGPVLSPGKVDGILQDHLQAEAIHG